MRIILCPLLWVVTALIAILAACGISLEWGAHRLVPFQKFLSKKIDGHNDTTGAA